MSMGLMFWVLMLLWFVFSLVSAFGGGAMGQYGPAVKLSAALHSVRATRLESVWAADHLTAKRERPRNPEDRVQTFQSLFK